MDELNFGQTVMKICNEINRSDARDCNLKRENGNINGDTPMGAMLQQGANTAKEYYLETMVDPEIANLHRKAGFIFTTSISTGGRPPVHKSSCVNCLRVDLIPAMDTCGSPSPLVVMRLLRPLLFRAIRMISTVGRASLTLITPWAMGSG